MESTHETIHEIVPSIRTFRRASASETGELGPSELEQVSRLPLSDMSHDILLRSRQAFSSDRTSGPSVGAPSTIRSLVAFLGKWRLGAGAEAAS